MLVASLHLHCVSTMFSTLIPPSGNVCAADGYTGLWRGGGGSQCRSTLQTIGLGLFLSFSRPAFGLKLRQQLSVPHSPYVLYPWGSVVLATCQALGMPAEQEWHAYAVPFFPLGPVFLPSEDSVLRLDG